ncbi:MAG: urea carboxylase-associated family protein [Rhodoferax sp.]|uniref:urea carboxylase-associated family protein n=1 Tax=Rhodoferax sp. TaxID=50421 RepID=UPI0032650DD8
MSQHRITLLLNQQQLELIDRTIATGAAADRVGIVRRALQERELPAPPRAVPPAPALDGLDTHRELLAEYVIEPGTGKALELLKGQLLRIEQVEGGQCADFNCFNLHDYKEFMHTGRTRTVHGLLPTAGHFLWSAPPRERAMVYILEDSARCNDVLFPRCSAYLYESSYGMPVHTNCHDIQSEAQREYGLTPDDVHDSFNLFMATEVHGGRGHISRQTTVAGDHVDMLALMDLLAVPNVCGADVMRTSNFSLKPLKLQIYQASARDLASVPPVQQYSNQRTPADFKIPNIRTERALRKDPTYQPQFTNVPLRISALDITLDAAEYASLQAAGLSVYYGDDDGAALRDVLFSWWETHYIQ